MLVLQYLDPVLYQLQDNREDQVLTQFQWSGVIHSNSLIVSGFVIITWPGWPQIFTFWQIFLEQQVGPPYENGKGATVNVEHLLQINIINKNIFCWERFTWKVRLVLKASPQMMFQLWPNVWSNFSSIKMQVALHSDQSGSVRSNKENYLQQFW